MRVSPIRNKSWATTKDKPAKMAVNIVDTISIVDIGGFFKNTVSRKNTVN